MGLDRDAWLSLQRTLHDAVQTLLQSYTSGRDDLCSGYRFAKAKHGQHLFTRTTAASPFLEVLSLGHSVRSLDDVLDLCYAATSEDQRILEGLVHGDKYLDAAVLETVFAATIDDPFRWLGTKTKQIYMTGGFEKRGTTFVEYSGSLTDDLGQRVLFIMRESMPGDLPRDVVAYRLQSISLFIEHATGRVQDVHYSFVDPQGKFPAWLFNQQVATHMPVTHRISMLAQKKRLLLAAMHQPVDYDDRRTRACGSCGDKLGVFHHKHVCLACHHVMCRRCLIKVPRALPRGAVAQEPFCKKCFVVAKDPKLPLHHLAWMDEDAILHSVIARRRFYSNQAHTASASGATLFDDKCRRSSVGVRNSSITTTGSLADLPEEPVFAEMDACIQTQRNLVEQIRLRLQEPTFD
ncbi:hypothetical protein SDRG_16518 [Saprolegnia diclina VS20]|uniref:FYVE-type domain-containing protein n=1 Tax=Saprolegnia diclina (strain VS20) TaxID=1156394 RepID=T0R800_SAPDV|nr:hypothetical protein SDRG_16518 [Saprolegnia diclina VS20]EQC25622.1 hypothetical protein SDRG_16518 [Saprolegnia diclina VS20]|eukprot:XP_008620954.1 hypothetical protein SDRG_16518 [Saprolegnia diclina VS20]